MKLEVIELLCVLKVVVAIPYLMLFYDKITITNMITENNF